MTTLQAGEQIHLALHRTTLEQTPARVWDQDELAATLDATVDAWHSWSDLHQAYDGPWADLVHHSGLVLQGLSFQPSGAIVAAATTSLPEGIGGERNWDYRYSWVRDASFTMEALWVAACPDEADDFFAFLATAAASSAGRTTLQIMFGIGGEHDLSERALPHLAGLAGQRPVRVGNGAWNQRQIDVYGELLGAAHRLPTSSTPRPATRRFLIAAQTPPRRTGPRRTRASGRCAATAQHFLYSKVMCWVALDRAISLAAGSARRTGSRAGQRPRRDPGDRSSATAGASRPTRSPSTSARDDLDASNLMMVIVGFLPATTRGCWRPSTRSRNG